MTGPDVCFHETTEPVEIRSHITGGTETVARICTTCLTQLPTAWGCTACTWVDIRRLCDIRPTPILAEPCQEHA